MHFSPFKAFMYRKLFLPDNGLNEWSARTLHVALRVLLADEIVQVRDDLDGLAGDEEDGDEHQGDAKTDFLLLIARTRRWSCRE